MSAQAFELYIEELVLEGFPPGDRARIARAMEAELSRLLTNHEITSDKSIERLDHEFSQGKAYRAENVGVQIARSIYHGIVRQI